MKVTLGVVLLCHERLDVAAHLARIWSEGGACVCIHVDQRMSDRAVQAMQAELADLPDIHFVSDRRRCEWGTFALVDATLKAVRMLLNNCPQVTHVYLASGACLPLRPVNELTAYLAQYPDTDFIESVTATDVEWTVGGLNIERFQMYFPFSWRRQRALFDAFVAVQRRLRIRRRMPRGLVPHLGAQWWCLTRATLTAILDDPQRPEYDRFFHSVWIPDESYFQTVVRRHSVNIESRSLTLAKFDSQGKPYIFYDDHMQMLAQSGCFVARKIWPHATGLFRAFPQPVLSADGFAQSWSEPAPAHIDRLINQAVARRRLGRPGLYMQSRFPAKDRENGKTSARYGMLSGFSDLFPDFVPWLQGLLPQDDIHGHLLAPDRVQFARDATIGPGCISDSAQARDYDLQGFLTSLIRITDRRQLFQFSPRDNQGLNWFMATDPNARIFVITSTWAVPLLHSGMPFDDIRRIAVILKQREVNSLDILGSVWVKAKLHLWDLVDFLEDPKGVMGKLLTDLGVPPEEQPCNLPPMQSLDGLDQMLRKLRNAGLRMRLMGDFSHPGAVLPRTNEGIDD